MVRGVTTTTATGIITLYRASSRQGIAEARQALPSWTALLFTGANQQQGCRRSRTVAEMSVLPSSAQAINILSPTL